MPQGYIKGMPDVGWWNTQIQAGIEFRKKFAAQSMWGQWRDYYRGNWAPGVLPVNLFYMMIRTVVPRVYFRNPSVSIVARKPGALQQVLATMLQRIDNNLIRTMGVKQQMKRMVQNAFMFGTAVGKLGYGAEFTPTPDEEDTSAPIKGDGTKLPYKTEYRAGVRPNVPWFFSVHPKDFIVPKDTAEFGEARWIATEIERPLEDVKVDSRLSNTGDLKPTKTTGAVGKVTYPIQMVSMYEVRDMQTGKVFIIAPQSLSDKHLLFEDDGLQFAGRPTVYPLVFNTDDEVFWGVPDSAILEPQQLEMNEIRTQIMKHRRLTIIKFLFDVNAITPEEVTKMLSEDVNAGVQVKNINGVKVMQAGAIPIDLFRAIEQTFGDARETMGFSRNQFGEFNPRSGDTTATEAMIVKAASEIRVDERRDMLADILTDVIRDMHNIIFENWTEEQVVDVVGPQGATVFVKFTGPMLREGRYEVKVDPDTSIPETKALRERKAIELYGILRENPLVDPMKLTSYLLHELQGTAFDDMLRQMDLKGGGTPQNPMAIGDLTRLVAKGGGQGAPARP